jgi:hypothetical protein
MQQAQKSCNKADRAAQSLVNHRKSEVKAPIWTSGLLASITANSFNGALYVNLAIPNSGIALQILVYGRSRPLHF